MAAPSVVGDRLSRFAPSPARRRTDKVARGLLLAGTIVALVPLVLIIYYLLKQGLSAWTTSGFFTTDPTGSTFFGASSIGGIRSAIVGTIAMVALASLIAIPIGIGVALWLVEYGKNNAFAHVVRFFVDVLTGVPSIIFGLFIFIVLIYGIGTYAGYKGSLALSLLMLPIVIRSAEVILLLVPNALRESALALGAPRWKVVFSIVLPTALPGMLTGVLLAVARAAGETAPLLFTAAATNKTTLDLSGATNSLPVQIYNDVTSPTTAVVNRAWGAALTLVAMIFILNLFARLVSRRSRLS